MNKWLTYTIMGGALLASVPSYSQDEGDKKDETFLSDFLPVEQPLEEVMEPLNEEYPKPVQEELNVQPKIEFENLEPVEKKEDIVNSVNRSRISVGGSINQSDYDFPYTDNGVNLVGKVLPNIELFLGAYQDQTEKIGTGAGLFLFYNFDSGLFQDDNRVNLGDMKLHNLGAVANGRISVDELDLTGRFGVAWKKMALNYSGSNLKSDEIIINPGLDVLARKLHPGVIGENLWLGLDFGFNAEFKQKYDLNERGNINSLVKTVASAYDLNTEILGRVSLDFENLRPFLAFGVGLSSDSHYENGQKNTFSNNLALKGGLEVKDALLVQLYGDIPLKNSVGTHGELGVSFSSGGFCGNVGYKTRSLDLSGVSSVDQGGYFQLGVCAQKTHRKPMGK